MEEQKEMTFIQHLEVLRYHLMRSAIAIVVLAILAFVNKSFLFDTVIFGPKQADFPTFQWLCSLSEYLAVIVPSLVSDPAALCIGQDFPSLQNIDMAIGQELKYAITRGAAIKPRSLVDKKVVHRGEQIVLVATAGNMEVRMAGQALADATKGQRVRVKNLSSKRIVEGIVDAPGIVRIMM